MASSHNTGKTLADALPLIQQSLAQGESVRFTPGGTSMLPMLRPDRDVVTLSPLPQRLKKYDLPLYRRADGQFVLHRVVKVGDTYTCIGDHQFQKETGLRHEQMIGLVTEFVREGKTVKVTHWRYRLYCRVWHHSRFLRRCWLKLRRIFSKGKKK